jgi:type II secretory pathway pseudopilin PulG
MLVVIGIVALVVVVLLPVLSAGRDAARQAACLANVNQLLLATLGYAADRKDRLPTGPGSAVPLKRSATWDRFFCNWVWIGATRQPTGRGVLMVAGYLNERASVLCPGGGPPGGLCGGH